MSAYTPHDVAAVCALGVTLGATLLAGFCLSWLRWTNLARAGAWALVSVAVAAAAGLCAHQPPGIRMLGVIAVLLTAMKAVVVVEARAVNGLRLTLWQWLAFATWPGMQPAAFATSGKGPLPGARELLRCGVIRLVSGVALIGVSRLVWLGTASRTCATIALLPGLSLVVHFGLFNIGAGLWRRCGVECDALFRAPLAARSLGEFWARRWNLAFSEMTAMAVYRPLLRRVGRAPATVAAFLFSGVLHELAISLPVRRGYGLPLAYFVVQGGLVLIERALQARGRAIAATRWAARVWVLGWLALPLPLLFHPPFLAGVIWPLIGIPAP